MSAQAGKGKGHQSQREFVHIQSRQNVPHIKVYENASKCIQMENYAHIRI